MIIINLKNRIKQTNENIVLRFSVRIEDLKDILKDLQNEQNSLKKDIRPIMLEELKVKRLQNDIIEIEIRERSSFDKGLLNRDYPELYKKYTTKETKTIVTEEIIFDVKSFKKFHEKEYNECLVKGTPGIYIKRR